jgi:hypothetical protein
MPLFPPSPLPAQRIEWPFGTGSPREGLLTRLGGSVGQLLPDPGPLCSVAILWPVAGSNAGGGWPRFAAYVIVGDGHEYDSIFALAGQGTVARVTPEAPVAGSPPFGQQVAQVRGVLAERVVISTMLDPFLTLKALVGYSGIGLRKLYEYLTDPVHPLPHYRVGGKIVVRRSEFDAWIAAYRRLGGAEVGAIVAGVLTDFRSASAR